MKPLQPLQPLNGLPHTHTERMGWRYGAVHTPAPNAVNLLYCFLRTNLVPAVHAMPGDFTREKVQQWFPSLILPALERNLLHNTLLL
jgi:hypothetical protein